MGEVRAAVDVGSNSVRLLVTDGRGARITRLMTITRLAAGVDETGNLDDDALARTLDTIRRYRDVWTHHGAGAVRIAATSAIRDARDRDRFFAAVRDVTGLEAEVLTGQQEAATTFAGVTTALPQLADPVAVVDVGGGSTELVLGSEARVRASVSLQLGCVRLTEQELVDDPPSTAQVTAARRRVVARLQEADEAIAAAGGDLREARTLVAVAGTATTLAALHLGLDTYREDAIHRTVVPAVALTELTGRLVAMPSRERAALGAMAPGREDVIAAGSLILDAVVDRYGFDEVVVSEADILDGLAATAGA